MPYQPVAVSDTIFAYVGPAWFIFLLAAVMAALMARQEKRADAV